jgi:hypothetical protein
VRFSAKTFIIVLQDSELSGWTLTWLSAKASISYYCFAICSNSCMSGDIFLTSATYWRRFWRVLRAGFVMLIFIFLLWQSCVAIGSGSLVETVLSFFGVIGFSFRFLCADLSLLRDTLDQLFSHRNLPTGGNIWSQVPEWARHQDTLSYVTWTSTSWKWKRA